MNDEEQRAAACTGKERFGTWKLASLGARRPRYTGRRGHKKAGRTAYHCTFCAWYHFGSIRHSQERPYTKGRKKQHWNESIAAGLTTAERRNRITADRLRPISARSVAASQGDG